MFGNIKNHNFQYINEKYFLQILKVKLRLSLENIQLFSGLLADLNCYKKEKA